MKYFFFITLFFYLKSYSNTDRRNIEIYYFEGKSSVNKSIKYLNKDCDSLLVDNIKLIFEKQIGFKDTIECNYINNEIFFIVNDTSNINKINLLLTFIVKNKILKFNIPFYDFFLNTNDKSNILISFEQEKKMQFLVKVIKKDFPYIINSYKTCPSSSKHVRK